MSRQPSRTTTLQPAAPWTRAGVLQATGSTDGHRAGVPRERTIEVIDDVAALEALRDEWERLHADVPGPNSQLDLAIGQGQLLASGERLQIVTTRHDGRLTGAAVLKRTAATPGLLRFLDTDANGFLYLDEAHLDDLVDAVLELRRPLFLECLVAGSATARAFQRRARRGWYVHETRRLGGPSVPIDGSWRDPLSKLSKSRRADLRRAMRRAEQSGEVCLEVEAPGTDVGRCFDEMVQLEARSWKLEAGTALARDGRQREALRRYVTAPAVRDRVRITRMRVGGATVAIDLNVVVGDRLWGVKGGVDDRFRAGAPGLQLKALAMKVAAEEGLERFEFMGGSAPYKEMWGTGPVPLVHLRLYPPSIRGVSALGLDALAKAGRAIEGTWEQQRSGGGSRGRAGGGGNEGGNARLATPDGHEAGEATAARAAFRHPGHHMRSGPHHTVCVVEDPAQLERLRASWRQLRADAPGPSSHLDWVLTHAASRRTDERLCVVTVHRRGRLTAAAPLMRSRGLPPRLRLAILDASGFLYEDEEELARLVDAVLALPLPLSLDLLPSGSPTDRLVEERMPGSRFVTYNTRTAGATVDLDASWQDPLAKLSSRRRNDLRRKLRKAEELGPVRFDVYAAGEDLAQHFASFVEAEGSEWKRREGTALIHDDARREELWSYINGPDVRDGVRIATMRIGDRIVAADLGVISGGRYWFFKGGYAQEHARVSPGVLLKVHTLAWAAEQGLDGYEFMGDREPYKAAFGEGQEQRTIRVFGPNGPSLAALMLDGGRKVVRVAQRRVTALELPTLRRSGSDDAEEDPPTNGRRQDDEHPPIAPLELEGRTVVTVTELGRWRDAWDELVLAAPLPSPFLRSWWLDHVVTAAPRFVLVIEESRLIGGLALQEDRVLGTPRFRVLGHGPLVPDHLDAVAVRDRRDDVAAALGAWCRRPGQRMFDLDGVVADSIVARALPAPVVTEQVEEARYRSLPEDPAEIVPSISGSERTAVKRGRKKLTKAGAQHRIVPPEEVDACLARLRHLHELRWGDESGFLGHFELFAAAARDGIPRGEVVFHELVVQDRVVCVIVELHLGDRVFSYQDGRDPDRSLPSPGSVLQAYAMEHACELGRREYDFLRGSFGYKSSWTDAGRPVLRLRAAQGPIARTTLRMLDLRERAGDVKGRARRRVVAGWTDATRAVGELREQRRHRRIDRALSEGVQVLADREELEPLRSDWSALCADVPGPNSELDWVLARASTLRAHERLQVVTVHEDGRCVGAAPLVEDTRVGTLGLVDDEACGFVYRDDRALTRLVDALLSLRRPLALHTLPLGSTSQRLLRARASHSRVVVGAASSRPSLALDETWTQPLDRLSSSRRRDVRRRRRRADERGVVELEVLAPGDAVEGAFEELVQVDATSWTRRTRAAEHVRREDLLRRYVRSPQVRDRVRLTRMRLDGRTIAAELGIIVGDRYWSLASSHDEAHGDIGAGILPKIETIRWAAESGLERYEFVGQDEHHERSFGAEPVELCSVKVHPINLAGAAAGGRDLAARLRRRLEARWSRG